MTSARLAQWYHENNIKNLIKALREGDFTTRELAAGYLGKMKAKEALPDLKNAIHDPVKTVVTAASQALLQIGIDEATKKALEYRVNEIRRIESNHQKSLELVVEKRGDPRINELNKMKEIVMLADARKKLVAEKGKTIREWAIAASILGLIAILTAIAMAIDFFR